MGKEVANLVSDNQQHVAPRKNDLLGTMADTCRARKELHFVAEHSFVETMREMIAVARSEGGAASAGSEYLAPMWAEDKVVQALEGLLHSRDWIGLSAPERSGRIAAALDADPA